MDIDPSSPAEAPPALPMVCGRQIAADPRYVPQASYQGRTIFFCTEFCRNAFEADPERFTQVHSRQFRPIQAKSDQETRQQP